MDKFGSWSDASTNVPVSRPRKVVIGTCLILLLFFYFTCDPSTLGDGKRDDLTSARLVDGAWSELQHHVSLLDVPGITHGEFLHRQATLAAALRDEGVDAFIAEPSASSAYYANISTSFELSERPFLMMLDASGEFSYLAPTFELDRIAALDMAYTTKTVIAWAEDESPYAILRNHTKNVKKVMVDEHARYMIASGLQDAGFHVMPMSFRVQSIRAVKSDAEIDLLRGINAFTVELVRAVRHYLKIGMTQETIVDAAQTLFSRAGVGSGVWAIVLFGESAAQPHGGATGLTLKDGEFVLIDIGSSLHGYGSDVTRTVLPTDSHVTPELLRVWHTVLDAQSAAIDLMWPNTTCSTIDAASRQVIVDAGYGDAFTHRLGHGLGLEMHEHPYLNGANQEPLKLGNVVTNEPGIYVTHDQAQQSQSQKGLEKAVGFGIRIEDAVLVTSHGGIVLTRSRATSPYHP